MLNLDAPFGTMIERTCDNIQWSQEKMDDNVYQVEVSGTMQTIKYHSELEGIPFYFTLVATYHGDTVYAELWDGSCINGYYSLNLVQVRYNQFVSDYPEYSTAYYRTNILGLGNENVSTGNTDTPEISQGLGRDWLMETFFPGISYDTLPAVFKQEIDNYAAASDSAGFVDALITDTYVDIFDLDLIANEILSQSFYDLEESDQCMMILWYCMDYNDGVSFVDFCHNSSDYLGY